MRPLFRRPFLFVVTPALLLAVAAPLFAAVQLRFEPASRHLAVGETGSVSIVLDEAMDIRTVELWIRFDDEVVASLGGHAGALFAGTGCTLFADFDDDTAGEWYGGVVTLGPACFVTGPGELYRWDFQGSVDGFCAVIVDNVKLYDPLANPVDGADLGPAALYIGTATSVTAVPEPPLALHLNPNPFNPATVVLCSGRAGESAALSVYDARGRLIAEPWQGVLGREPVAVRWDGRDLQGRAASGGVFFFRLRGENGRAAVWKGVLTR